LSTAASPVKLHYGTFLHERRDTMAVFRKGLVVFAAALLLWLGTAATADAHGYRWRGHGWGWGGHRWGGYGWGGWRGHGWGGWHGHGWGGYRWGGHGWGGYRWGGHGWGYPRYAYGYGLYGSRFGLSYYGPGWGIGLGYSYSPVYYAPAYYYSWPGPVYSYYAAAPVVIDARQPVIIDPSTSVARAQLSRQDGPEQLPAPNVDAKPARVEVVVSDPNAEVWFGNHQTKAKGLKRAFETPNLQPGKSYSYAVTVSWTENGVAKRETRRVGVQPGSTVVAVFTQGDQPPPIPEGEKRLPVSMKVK
jgi:uncharacterized protein (TIGR03000 family)